MKTKKNLVKLIMLGILVFSIFSCSSPLIQKQISINPKINEFSRKTAVILPFDDDNRPSYKTHFPNAKEVVREAFETAFVKTGAQVVERNKVDVLLNEMKFSASGLSEADGVKVGKMLNADTVIFGTLTVYVQGKRPSQSVTGKLERTTVGFTVKAVNVETGTILWKATVTNVRGGRGVGVAYTESVEGHAIEVAESLVDDLIEKGLKY